MEQSKQQQIEFDGDELDETLYKLGLDWSFDKPNNKPYTIIYILEKEEEEEEDDDDEEEEEEEEEEEFEYNNYNCDKTLDVIQVAGGGLGNGNAYATIEKQNDKYYYCEYGKNAYKKYVGNKIVYDLSLIHI